MSGWIKLHRKINKNPILKKNRTYSNFEAFIWLLMKANYDDAKVVIGSTIYKLKQGQMITSQKKLCKQFGWGNSRLNTFLKLLKNDSMIEVKSNKQLTMITLLNWDSYQDSKLQTNHKQITNKSQPNTNKKNIINKEKDFVQKVLEIGKDKYKQDMIDDFSNYWTERNASGHKMKFEMSRTFDINRRLSRWYRNSFEFKTKSKELKVIQSNDDAVDKMYRDQQERMRLAGLNACSDEEKKEMLKINNKGEDNDDS